MTRVISISDDAYNYLKTLKDDGESFTKIIKRLVPKVDKKKLLELAGRISQKDSEIMLKTFKKGRDNIKFRNPKFD